MVLDPRLDLFNLGDLGPFIFVLQRRPQPHLLPGEHRVASQVDVFGVAVEVHQLLRVVAVVAVVVRVLALVAVDRLWRRRRLRLLLAFALGRLLVDDGPRLGHGLGLVGDIAVGLLVLLFHFLHIQRRQLRRVLGAVVVLVPVLLLVSN